MAKTRSGSDVSRRQFIATVSLPLLAGACERIRFGGSSASLPRSVVGLFPASTYAVDLSDVIFRGFQDLGVDLRGRRVLLKPNMVEYEPGTSINTNPLVVAGAAVACRRAGAASVTVAEGPGHRRDIEYLLSATGLANHLRELKLPFTDLNHDDVRMVPIGNGFTKLQEIALPATLLASDFVISMPKLKTHHWAGITCSMKNLFGVVPGAVYGWPKNILHIRGIYESILDLTATVRPHFAIVDAITAMEGDGPIMGKPRPLGFIAMGADPVAVDATCARIIGLDPAKIGYLHTADGLLGNANNARIDHRGEAISRYATQFDLIPEMRFMRPA
ncbi:MAG TPA: DUF362 domain-containing protein [Vicinamibacterales bacterium]|nr:DUF362 domain-containing protein [Vicinamibacterales bacterium]